MLLSSPNSVTSKVVLDEENPWPGLASYGEDLHSFFFGRALETRDLANLVDRGVLVLLYGRSGLGKSSLINAGLREELRKRRRTYLPIPVSLRLALTEQANGGSETSLVQRVKEEVSLVLKREQIDAREPMPDETLYEYFHRKDIDFWDQQNHLLIPVLLFDQFEEIFTLGRAHDLRHRQTEYFLQELCALAEGVHTDPIRRRFAANPDLQSACDFEKIDFKILVCIREDYLPYLTEREDVLPSVLRNSMRLEEMDEEQAREAVVKPGAHILAPGAEDRIIDFVATERGGKRRVDPSILSLVCQQLNEERKQRQKQSGRRELIEPQHLTEERAVKIIDEYYRDSLVKFPRFRELIESKLITQDGFRAVLPEAEILKSAEVGPSELDWLIGTRRILVRENLDGNTPWVRLSHDRLAAAARQGRIETELKRQKEEAEERERTTRRNLKRAQRGLAITAVLLMCAIGAFIWAFRERHDRKHASDQEKKTAQRYQQIAEQNKHMAIRNEEMATAARKAEGAANAAAAEANAQRDVAEANRHIAYLFEIRGAYNYWQDGQTAKARSLLAQAMPSTANPNSADVRGWEWYLVEGLCDLRDTGESQTLNGHTDTVNLIVPVPAQPHPMLVSAGADTTLRLWDATTGKEIKQLISHHELIGLGFTYEQRKNDKAIIVNRVFGGGPAARSNKLKRNDRIVKVASEGQSLTEVTTLTAEQIADLLDPDSTGRKVQIEIEHPVTNNHETFELASEKFTAEVKHDSEIIRLAVSPDGAHLASADVDGQILLWDIHTGEIAGAVYTGEDVIDLAFSPNKPWLATAFRDGKRVVFCGCKAWKITRPKDMPMLDRAVTAFAFGPGATVAIATEDGLVRLWDVEKQIELRRLSFGKPGEQAQQLAFSRDGSVLAAGSGSVLKLFHIREPALPPLSLVEGGYSLQFALDPTGRYLATARTDGTVQIWDVPTGKVVRALKGHSGAVHSVAFLSDSLTLASGADDRTIRLWNLQRTPPDKFNSFDTDISEPAGICFSSEGRYLACSDPWSKQIAILDATDGRVLRTISGSVWHTAFLPSQPLLAVPDEKNTIQLIDATTGVKASGVPVFEGHNAPIRCIAFDSQGDKMASGDEHGNAIIWNTATAQKIQLLPHDSAIKSVAFSPDGKWLALSNPANQKIEVWDPGSARLIYDFKLRTVGLRLCFSPDSTCLLVDEQNGRLDLINLKTGNNEKTLVGHNGPVYDLAFSPDWQRPDARRIISVGEDSTLRVWDVKSGSEIFTLDTSKAVGLAFSPDGMRLATLAGPDVRVWDAALFSAERHKEDWLFYAGRGHYYQLEDNWSQAIADYKQALLRNAELPAVRLHLAYSYGAIGDFEKAETECGVALRQSTEEAKIKAIAQLETVCLPDSRFDREKYYELARQATNLAENKYDPETANSAVWLCCMVPGAAEKPDDLVELMRRVTQDQPREYAYKSTLGAILYRAGHYDEAIKALRSAMSMKPAQPKSLSGDQFKSQHDRDGTALEWIFLAMAHQKLGQKSEAKKWLKQVADQLDRFKQDPMFDDPNWSWDWEQILQLKTLYTEAQELINKTTTP